MIKEAIVLAGGLGTRLRDAVPDLPKCMAPVAGKPFLVHVINALRMQGVEHFIFSLGYKAESIIDFLKEAYPKLSYTTVIEDTPLGTGGAIQLALKESTTNQVLVANGDTLFKIDLASMEHLHNNNGAACTLALKPLTHFDRYGVVEIDKKQRISSFREKQFYVEGLINGGIYLIDKSKFLEQDFPERFSFEKDYLETHFSKAVFMGSVQEGYFIDIGIPEDFEKANVDLLRPKFDTGNIDRSWTLFLDRDGVLNEEKKGDYIRRWDEFIFSKGVLEVMKQLSELFGRIIVVSNQRGVGKGLMSEADLQSIHLEMQREIAIVGGRIDRFYYCTETDDKCYDRKPNPGMAFRAMREFPDILPDKSVMVGNKLSDMQFGRAAGMVTVYVKTTNPDQAYPHPDIDLIFDSLRDFAVFLRDNGQE